MRFSGFNLTDNEGASEWERNLCVYRWFNDVIIVASMSRSTIANQTSDLLLKIKIGLSLFIAIFSLIRFFNHSVLVARNFCFNLSLYTRVFIQYSTVRFLLGGNGTMRQSVDSFVSRLLITSHKATMSSINESVFYGSRDFNRDVMTDG